MYNRRLVCSSIYTSLRCSIISTRIRAASSVSLFSMCWSRLRLSKIISSISFDLACRFGGTQIEVERLFNIYICLNH